MKLTMSCRAQDCNELYVVTLKDGETASQYCSKTCRNRANRHRKAERVREMNAPKPQPIPQTETKPFSKRNVGSSLNIVGRCSWPFKRVFRTEDEAYRAIQELDDPDMSVYVCLCGGRHIGHGNTSWKRKKARQKYYRWLNRQGAGNADDLDTVIVQGSTP